MRKFYDDDASSSAEVVIVNSSGKKDAKSKGGTERGRKDKTGKHLRRRFCP